MHAWKNMKLGIWENAFDNLASNSKRCFPDLWLCESRHVVHPHCRTQVIDLISPAGVEQLLSFQDVIEGGLKQLEVRPVHRPVDRAGVQKHSG